MSTNPKGLSLVKVVTWLKYAEEGMGDVKINPQNFPLSTAILSDNTLCTAFRELFTSVNGKFSIVSA
jgi:hypothetical protein